MFRMSSKVMASPPHSGDPACSVPLPSRARQSADEALDRREHRLLSAGKEPMIIAVELDELSTGNSPGDIAPRLNARGPVVPAVQHERGYGNKRQEFSDIGIAKRLEDGPNAAR